MPGTRSFQHFYKRALLDSNRENKRPRIEMDRISDTTDDFSFPSNDSVDELHHLASDGVHSPPSTLASRSHIDTNGTSLRDIDLEQNLLEESLDDISFHSLESSASNGNKESEDDLGFTKHDCFVHELITVCDASGAPRHFYDTIMQTIRRQTREGLDPFKAPRRDTFLSKLRSKLDVPGAVQESVGNLKVTKFHFGEMLEDLINAQSHLMSFGKPQITEDTRSNELTHTQWYADTYDNMVKDPTKEVLLALILYGDKTGTDVNQRYALEPWMFTFANIPILSSHCGANLGSSHSYRR